MQQRQLLRGARTIPIQVAKPFPNSDVESGSLFRHKSHRSCINALDKQDREWQACAELSFSRHESASHVLQMDGDSWFPRSRKKFSGNFIWQAGAVCGYAMPALLLVSHKTIIHQSWPCKQKGGKSFPSCACPGPRSHRETDNSPDLRGDGSCITVFECTRLGWVADCIEDSQEIVIPRHVASQ